MSDFFDNNDPNELLSVGEMMVYDNQYVVPLEEDIEKVKLDVGDNESRITALEHQIPGGGGGTGAFLNLGGVPGRYPLASECVGAAPGDESGFMVVARPDGVYFYNPTTKQLIAPKQGGGSIAVQGQLPSVFLDEHKLLHSGRASKSGLYLANYDDIGITQWTNTDKLCTVMVVAGEREEQQTVFSAEGVAYRVFPDGVQTGVDWVYHGAGTGTGDVMQADLESGDQRVSWNTLSAGVSIDYLNIGASKVAGSPFIINTSNAERNISLPPMVPLADTPAAGEVRTGRLTYLINSGSFPKIVKPNTNQKFYVNGSAVTEDQIVPPKTTHIYVPYTSVAGEGSWAFVGVVPYDKAVSLLELAAGSPQISGKCLTQPLYEISTQINADKVAGFQLLVGTGGGTGRFIMLPEIINRAEAPTSAQVRDGYKCTVYNQSTGNRTLRVATGQFFYSDGITSDLDRTLPPKTREDLWAVKLANGSFVWIHMNRSPIVETGVVLTQDEKDYIAGLQSGNKFIHEKSWVRPTSLITGTTISADQLAAGGNIIAMPTAPCTATVPKIVGLSATTLASNEVRLGTEMAIYNHGSSAITVNFVDNRRWVKGVEAATGSIGGGKFTRYLATHISGSNYCWVVLDEGNTGK